MKESTDNLSKTAETLPSQKGNQDTKATVLLGIAPFWSPLIPPMGIAALKSYIEPRGYRAKTVDMNVEEPLKELYYLFFDTLKTFIPEEKIGNLYNIGHDVLQNQMMAHIHYTKKEDYIELVKMLVYKYFYVSIDNDRAERLSTIFDTFYSRLETYFTALLEEVKPHVVGLTVYCGNLPASMFLFKLTKEKYPNIKTVMGGGIFSQQLSVGSPNLDFLIQKAPYIDTMIIGEGQKLFYNYLEGNLPPNKRLYTLKDIKNDTMDLSAVCVPDYSDLDLHKYAIIGASGSRSCPNKCAFCNARVFWGEYTRRDMSVVVKEMKTLHQKHNIQLFYMSDSLLNRTISDLSDQMIHNGHSLYFDGYLRAYEPESPLVSDIENTMRWRKAGFYRARIGCETGSQPLLDLVSKGVTIEQVKSAISSLAYAGIKTTTYWVVGLPGETEDDFQATLDLLTELKNDIYQAECAAFIYYYNGQNSSDDWASKRQLLFPQKMKDMLITQTWILDTDPQREVVYDRLHRFVRHIKQLGIPNPFTLHEIHKADERWKRLHKNAVPSLLQLDSADTQITENLNIENVMFSKSKLAADDGDFAF